MSTENTVGTIFAVAIIVPCLLTGVGIAAVVACKRRQRRQTFAPFTLETLSAQVAGTVPVRIPSPEPLPPIRVTHERNVRQGTLLEWPSQELDPIAQPSSQIMAREAPALADDAEDDDDSDTRPVPSIGFIPQQLPTPFTLGYSAEVAESRVAAMPPSYAAADPLPHPQDSHAPILMNGSTRRPNPLTPGSATRWNSGIVSLGDVSSSILEAPPSYTDDRMGVLSEEPEQMLDRQWTPMTPVSAGPVPPRPES